MSGEKAETTLSKRSNDREKGRLRPLWRHPRAV
jgi:hypothetical protein